MPRETAAEKRARLAAEQKAADVAAGEQAVRDAEGAAGVEGGTDGHTEVSVGVEGVTGPADIMLKAYVSTVGLPGGVRPNVVFVATEDDPRVKSPYVRLAVTSDAPAEVTAALDDSDGADDGQGSTSG